jgi:hypothetical protein
MKIKVFTLLIFILLSAACYGSECPSWIFNENVQSSCFEKTSIQESSLPCGNKKYQSCIKKEIQDKILKYKDMFEDIDTLINKIPFSSEAKNGYSSYQKSSLSDIEKKAKLYMEEVSIVCPFQSKNDKKLDCLYNEYRLKLISSVHAKVLKEYDFLVNYLSLFNTYKKKNEGVSNCKNCFDYCYQTKINKFKKKLEMKLEKQTVSILPHFNKKDVDSDIFDHAKKIFSYHKNWKNDINKEVDRYGDFISTVFSIHFPIDCLKTEYRVKLMIDREKSIKKEVNNLMRIAEGDKM